MTPFLQVGFLGRIFIKSHQITPLVMKKNTSRQNLIIILFLNTACLYIACRQEGVPRTFKEIVAVSTVSKKEIGRCFKVKFLLKLSLECHHI